MDLINEKDFNEIVACLAYSEIKRTGFKQDLIKEGGQHKICIVAARHGYTDMLKVIKSKNLSNIIFDERVSSAAAFNGHLLTLQWLKGNGCICDADTCKSAAEGGQKEVLEWLKKSGCPWDYRTTEIAALQCNVDILKWAIENGCEWDPAIWSTLLNAIRSKIKADIKIAKGKKNNTQSSTERKWRPLFDIFFWADDEDLCREKSDGLIKCLRFLRFCTFKIKLKLLKKRHHKEKYVKAQKQWEDLTLTVKALVDGNNAPFYWSVAKKKFDFYVDNIEYFDNSEIYKNDDKIIGEIIVSEEETLKKSEDEILKLTEVHLQTKGPDVDDEPNGDEDDTEDLEVEGTEKKDDADGNLDESDMQQIEEDVSNGSLEFSSQVQNW